MKEKLFYDVNCKLKKAAFILVVGGLLLVVIMSIFALSAAGQYAEYYGSAMPYIFTTLVTYVAMGFFVLVGAWALYSFAELAENTKGIKDAFFDDEACEWGDEEESCSCGCGSENVESDVTEEME